MKKLWMKIINTWSGWMEEDEHDTTKKHLSKADKRSICFGAFIVCAMTIGFTQMYVGWYFRKSIQEEAKYLNEIRNTVIAYLSSATTEEYDAIAETLRRDLIYDDFSHDKKSAIKYIPNTTKKCRLCLDSFPYQVSLLCTNTGMIYSLDLYEKGEVVDADDFKGTSVSWGYDEVSQTSIQVSKTPSDYKGLVSLDRSRGIISVHRMKALFCDECIEDILSVTDYGIMPEFVIMDGQTKTFYPIESGEVQIGNYKLDINCVKDGYEIVYQYED